MADDPTGAGPVIDTASGADDIAALQSQLAGAQGEEAEAKATLAADKEGYDPGGAADAALAEHGTFTQPTPQDHFNDIMRQAPLLMALGAIGGTFGKQHGITMLASTNAMMKGIVQGDADAYKEARDKYDEQYAQFKEKSKTWMDVYKAYSAAYKGRIDADQLAVKGANAATGALNTQIRMTKRDIANSALITQKMDQSNALIAHMSNQDTVAMMRAQNDKEKADATASRADTASAAQKDKAATNAAKASGSNDDIKDALIQAKKLQASLHGQTGALGNIGLGGAASRGIIEPISTRFGGDDPATKFDANLKLTKALATSALKTKGSRLTAAEKTIIMDVINMDAPAISTKQGNDKIQAMIDVLQRKVGPETKVIDGKTYKSLGDGRWVPQ